MKILIFISIIEGITIVYLMSQYMKIKKKVTRLIQEEAVIWEFVKEIKGEENQS